MTWSFNLMTWEFKLTNQKYQGTSPSFQPLDRETQSLSGSRTGSSVSEGVETGLISSLGFPMPSSSLVFYLQNYETEASDVAHEHGLLQILMLPTCK